MRTRWDGIIFDSNINPEGPSPAPCSPSSSFPDNGLYLVQGQGQSQLLSCPSPFLVCSFKSQTFSPFDSNRTSSTFSPLIFSAIFYAANGRNHISYIDSLYNCVSATTVCGLASVDLSALTGFQQALLFIQSSLGNPVRSKDRKSTRLNSSHSGESRMPSSA